MNLSLASVSLALVAASGGAFAQPLTQALGANLVVNGDFEAITGSGCQYNLTNSVFSASVTGATAFGIANELDIMTGACYGPAAVSGVTKVGLAVHPSGALFEHDEFSLPLSSPTTAGARYTLSMWVMAETTFSPDFGALLVTLTNNPSARGSAVHAFQPTASNSWQFTSLTFVAPVAASHITFSNTTAAYCWLHLDDVQLELAPAATVFCTSGTTSQGCVPSMTFTGAPAVGSPTGFDLHCTDLEGQRTGLMFYGINGATSLVWAAGSTSFMCVKPPSQRLPAQSSGGTAGACDGQITNDFNSFMFANPGALGAPFGSGTTIHLQTWFRDPPAPKATSLSEGLTFTL